MYLSDREIKRLLEEEELVIRSTAPECPFHAEKQIQPGSIDLRVGDSFLRYSHPVDVLDLAVDAPHLDDLFERVELNRGESITIEPSQILITNTLEWLELPGDVAGKLSTRNRIARLGVSAECADFVNPGAKGVIALHIVNHNDFPIRMYPYMSICQISLIHLASSPLVPRDQRSDAAYHLEHEVAPSVLHLDPEVERIVRNTQIPFSDRRTKQMIKQAVESILRQDIMHLQDSLQIESKKLQTREDLAHFLKQYTEANREATHRRKLRITFWLASLAFTGGISWLLTNVGPLMRGSIELIDAAVPLSLAVFALIVMIISYTGELF